MRPEGLRAPTAKAAADEAHKLQTRLSRGEKRNRKRMATVASVYDAAPAPRTPRDVLARTSPVVAERVAAGTLAVGIAGLGASDAATAPSGSGVGGVT